MAFSLPSLAQRRVLALVPAILVLMIGALAYDRARSVVADVEAVGRSHEVIEVSDGVLTRAVDAETGQRAFLLTGEEPFLDPYRGARSDIDRYLDSLRTLTHADPAQTTRVRAIEALIPVRFAQLDSGIAMRRQDRLAAAANSDRLLTGKEKMDELRRAVANLQTHERGVLTEKRSEERSSVRNASVAIAIAGMAALLLSALINLTFSRAVLDREAANVELRSVNEDLEQQSVELETQAAEMESQAAELEVTAEDLRSTNEALTRSQMGTLLLSEASRALASTLDYERTLETIAKLAVGDLAEWCAVDLVEESGNVRQSVVAHVDEAKVKWAKELNKRYPPDYSGPTGVGHVIRTGQPEIYPEITDAMLVAAARDEQHLGITRELQIKSAIIVPMLARGQTLGALTLISTQKGRRYDDADLAIAMELATRAALAIDNARLYRSALEGSEAKSAFLATMSHELRTPLNAIIGYQSLLQEGIDGALNDAQLKQLSRIRTSADHLLDLIDEVLTFSRVEAGKEIMRQDELRLRPLVEEAVVMLMPEADAKGLSLRVDVPDAQLHTDGGKLRQILLNLLSNAVKFTDRGEVSVRARESEDRVEIQIIDTGLGIARENVGRIFDPFWQVEQSPTRRAGGTGLGLSVSRSLARLLGGDVSVESKVGKGSTFTLILPVRPV